MKNRQKFLRTLGTPIFTLGILAGIFLLALVVWSDLEASLFSSAMNAEKRLTTLHCPIFISPQETKKVTAKFNQPNRKRLGTLYTHLHLRRIRDLDPRR